jgi:hypothetical protein
MEANILNLAYAQFESDNIYDIPTIHKCDLSCEDINNSKLVGFNFAKTFKEPKDNGIHFFLHDYQFERVWNRPLRYIDTLKKFKYVLSPDFSPYADMPKAAKIFNVYRNRWCGRFWQENGINVIPTITIADKDSLDYCLAGVEENSVIAISTMGEGRWGNYRLLYEYYDEICNRLKPNCIVLYGKDLSTNLKNINSCKIIYKPYCNSNINEVDDE